MASSGGRVVPHGTGPPGGSRPSPSAPCSGARCCAPWPHVVSLLAGPPPRGRHGRLAPGRTPAAPPRLARRRDSRAAPSSRPRTSGTAASTGCPSTHDPEALKRSIGLDAPPAPRLRLVRRLRHPLERGRWRDRRAGRLVHVARRIRRGAVPHPAGAADRGRQRPPSPDRRPCGLSPLRALCRRARRRGLAGRLRRHLGPALERAAADAAGRARMRRACPSCPAWCATRGGARARSAHALRFTAPTTRRAFIYPARHFASDRHDPDAPARWACACD